MSNTIDTKRCQHCHKEIDALTLALLGVKKAQYCIQCETTWELKTAPVPGGFQVWEEARTGNRQHERVWWEYCSACEKGWFHAHQCSQCRTRIENARHAATHVSGAYTIPRQNGFSEPFVWFADCTLCQGGFTYFPFLYGGGEMRQCQPCRERYLQYLRDHSRIRYVVSRPNYPIKVKVDTTKTLAKSHGKIFYQEINYTAKSCEGTYVRAFEVDETGNARELYGYLNYFASLSDAQHWIFTQMGGNLHMFWFL